MDKFITKDDIWGIRRAVNILWQRQNNADSVWSNGAYHDVSEKQLCFDAFYNQQIPEAWRETLATVKRHAAEIEELASNSSYRGLVWFRRNNQINSGYLNFQLIDAIKKGEIELPTYMEIEEEKQKWQSHPQYNKERGFSEPIKEELIQIRIHK